MRINVCETISRRQTCEFRFLSRSLFENEQKIKKKINNSFDISIGNPVKEVNESYVEKFRDKFARLERTKRVDKR